MGHHSEDLIGELATVATDLRRTVVQMVHDAESGHLGGSLSAAEIVTALYFHHLRIDPDRPDWPNRDRFILSKGHAAPLLYVALARRGYLDEEELDTFRQLGSRLQGHPDRLKTPGVEMTAGLLGHGVSLGVGLALAAQLNGLDYHTYVLVGDGETQAGVIWEGAMAAAKYRLPNLTVILDHNQVQLDGPVPDIMPIASAVDKWRAFNWEVFEVDGHDMRQVLAALTAARDSGTGPTIIVAHTTKGKGVSFMEGQASWHGCAPDDAECAQALAELMGEV